MSDINKKTVLMLDHEPMLIDRRIVLEGQTLAKNGWRVVLATRGDGIKPAFEIERGIEVYRFVDAADEVLINDSSQPSQSLLKRKELNRFHDRQCILGWIHSPSNPDLFGKLKSIGLSDTNATFLYILAWPPEAAARLRKRFPKVKSFFGLSFEPAVYAALLRPSFCLPYLRLGIHRFKNRLWSFFGQANSVTWKTKAKDFALELKPDIIHAHDLPNLPMASEIADELNAILIYDAHELYPRQYFSDENLRKQYLDTERRYITKADAVISVNSQCSQVLEEEYGIKDSLPISNAMEHPVGFDPVKRKRLWHEHFSLKDDVRIIVFQGGINPVRNIDPLVESLASLPSNIHIGFITYAKDIPYYKEMTQRLSVFDRVHYVVEIPWNEVNDWLCSADAGIMPYQVTSFNTKISSPNKLYEFVVAGLPIIASPDLVNVKRAIEEDMLGILAPFKGADTYRDAIIEMFEQAGGPDRFRGNVLSARHKYLWSNEEPKLLEMYRRLSSRDFVPKAVTNRPESSKESSV